MTSDRSGPAERAGITRGAGRRRRMLWAVATALGCAVTAPALIAAPAQAAPTDYGQGRPLAVVAHAPGDEEVYWRGADGYLWETAESGGVWRGPMRTPVGGLASAPTATIGPGGYDYVFWEGTNRQLWEAANNSGAWTAATQVGMGPLGSQPTATSSTSSSGATEIDVFWYGTGTGVNLWTASYQSTTGKWSGPKYLGMGPLGSPPSATEQQTSSGVQIQVYWDGKNGALWEADTSGGSSWSGPTSHGMGPLGSAPAVASLSYGDEDVFWGGTYGRLWQAKWDSTSWNGVNLNGPTSVGFGPMASAPTVAAVAPDEYDVFWVGTDSNIWEAQLVGQTWTSVESRGPMVAYPPTQTAPVAVVVPPPPPAPGPAPQIRVEIRMKWHWSRSHTRLKKVQWVGTLPARATIRVTCHGRRCPRRPRPAGPRHLRGLVRSLEADVFRAGQRLTITVSAPGWIAQRAQVQIRDGKLPLVKLL